ncbi:MAG: bifunctional (p)ppGpp synthetase/guanosine-3',5'-bis(diphosphate) 3'-pyrophosphohydrolase [Paludibacteraceae bacterium]|nr:bifunctional (p)ppGpp synthetase/guanosine-3',5'-bis(diphosphate) 3'-pyrophosphohydrolase [Paludibacteraceae bacterium]
MTESGFTQEEEQTIEREFDALLDDYAHTMHQQKVAIVRRAFQFAHHAHRGVRRLSGEPYIMHPLAVARIVVREIGLGSTSICAALLHDVVEDTDYTVEDIEQHFNKKIADIVEGLTKISGGVFATQDEKQATNIRKLVLTMSDDVRVVLIKIADRLHNMRTLGAQSPANQQKIARETMFIYAPLAHRLGLFPIKSELEDLSFHYLHPDIYEEIDHKLSAVKEVQMEDFRSYIEPIKRKLTDMGMHFTVSARVKSVFSIWEKMQKKNIPFEDVYDLLAVRIIFEPSEGLSEKDQCWMIYSAITSIYRPHPERIRDWISSPKSNGYEALHVTVMSPFGYWVEVQIRSERMHELAEKGLAAHWKYKTDNYEESELDHWLLDIKDILDNPDTDAMAFLDTFKLNLFADEVFVFTPKGDFKTLPKDSTVLDFAYYIHSELGEHCIGAKVNHKMESITYRLMSGDQVEILTSQKQQPEPEWLNMVVTAKAQSAIKHYFNKQTDGKKRNIEPRLVKLLLRGNDNFGVLVKMLYIISDKMHLNLRSLHTEVEDKRFECIIELFVFDDKSLSQLCAELRQLPELTDVEQVLTDIQ